MVIGVPNVIPPADAPLLRWDPAHRVGRRIHPADDLVSVEAQRDGGQAGPPGDTPAVVFA
jgi:hypothetical protein